MSPWWKEGIRFECQGSGNCCSSRGEYGFVFLTLEDRRRIAKHLGISTTQFTKTYCQKYHGAYHLIEESGRVDCLFLKGKSCSIYQARPTQCRTWPFWPEVMSAKAWKKEVVSFCPGVGKGNIVSAKDIQKNLDQQKLAEKNLV
jgi:Fe-S-cluster containining protein